MSTANLISVEASSLLKEFSERIPAGMVTRSSKSKHAVCFRVFDDQVSRTLFYIIDVDDDDGMAQKKKETGADSVELAPVASLSLLDESLILHSGCVSFIIGGFENRDGNCFESKLTVYAFNMRCSSRGFDIPDSCPLVELPQMNVYRRSSGGLVHNHRIYVFGGVDESMFPCDDDDESMFPCDDDDEPIVKDADLPWAEVFDLEKPSEGWKPLHPPPVRFPAHFCVFAVLLNDKQILVGPTQGIRQKDRRYDIYNIDTDTWSDFNHKNPPAGIGGHPPFLVDDDEDNDRYLYWMSGATLLAYSIITHECYFGHLPFLSDYQSKVWDDCSVSYEPYLLHLGGRKFCVFIEDEDSEDEDSEDEDSKDVDRKDVDRKDEDSKDVDSKDEDIEYEDSEDEDSEDEDGESRSRGKKKYGALGFKLENPGKKGVRKKVWIFQ